MTTSAAVITESFDTFPGSASDPGWSSAWTATIATATTSNANPINGGGNYQSVNIPGLGDAVISRQLDSAVIDTLNAPYTVSWDVRFDAIGNFTAYEDRFHFTANRAGYPGSDTTASWLIGVVGGNDAGAGDYFEGKWYFYDNPSTTSNGNFNGASMVNTNIDLVEGHTYSFMVEVDPLAQTYSATIIDQTASLIFTQDNLNFRDQSTSHSHQHLIFGGRKNESIEARTFSIDNLVITPEPGRAMLCTAALAAFLLGRRR